MQNRHTGNQPRKLDAPDFIGADAGFIAPDDRAAHAQRGRAAEAESLTSLLLGFLAIAIFAAMCGFYLLNGGRF
jgi:hypothetical protein